ncbi:MAG: GAF domain-containing sensor histidine kinase [Chloroflexi bacterium]|nr:GAF domain-containing sensor histidine kinase [Chloroflexota bacterium]
MLNDIDLNELAAHGRLFQLYDQMLGEVDVVKVLHAATEVVRQILNAERATIYLVLKDTQELESAAVIGNVSRTIRIPIREDSLAGYCALTGRAFLIPDAYGDLSSVDPKLRFDRSWDEMNQFRTRDVMCAPAVFKGEVMGVAQVINSRGDPFQETELPPLESVSGFVAYALYHARLYDELATLKGLEKEKAEFMRIIVHELRSPVTASKALVTALRYTTRENPKQDEVLARVENRMNQMLGLVEDVLHLSRIKAGRPLGEIAVCDLVVDTRATCENYLDEAKAKGVQIEVDLPESPVPVRIDLQGYHLIISNLVSNAVKYTPAGSVKVSLRKNQHWAVLRVEDTGMGIPQEDIPKLFTEFFRASNARSSKIKGTGVGLAGVKELVERFGGQMEMASQENKGSVFTVRLLLYED